MHRPPGMGYTFAAYGAGTGDNRANTRLRRQFGEMDEYLRELEGKYMRVAPELRPSQHQKWRHKIAQVKQERDMIYVELQAAASLGLARPIENPPPGVPNLFAGRPAPAQSTTPFEEEKEMPNYEQDRHRFGGPLPKSTLHPNTLNTFMPGQRLFSYAKMREDLAILSSRPQTAPAPKAAAVRSAAREDLDALLTPPQPEDTWGKRPHTADSGVWLWKGKRVVVQRGGAGTGRLASTKRRVDDPSFRLPSSTEAWDQPAVTQTISKSGESNLRSTMDIPIKKRANTPSRAAPGPVLQSGGLTPDRASLNQKFTAMPSDAKHSPPVPTTPASPGSKPVFGADDPSLMSSSYADLSMSDRIKKMRAVSLSPTRDRADRRWEDGVTEPMSLNRLNDAKVRASLERLKGRLSKSPERDTEAVDKLQKAHQSLQSKKDKRKLIEEELKTDSVASPPSPSPALFKEQTIEAPDAARVEGVMQNRIAALEMECAELRGQVLEWKQIARDAATVSLSSQFERRKALPNAVDEMVAFDVATKRRKKLTVARSGLSEVLKKKKRVKLGMSTKPFTEECADSVAIARASPIFDNFDIVENAEAGWQTSDCLDGFDVVERSEIAIIGKMEEIMSSTTLDGFDVIESGERG